MIEDSKVCCFSGHRKIAQTDELRNQLYNIVEKMILEHDIVSFLFGSKSDFDKLCLSVVTELKNKYPHIKRTYVRAEYPHITESYKNMLLKSYDDTYYPEKIEHSGKAAYVERNYEMIDKSTVCIVYYDEKYEPPRRKNSKRDLKDYQPRSGTQIAYEYAARKNKEIINLLI